MPVFLRTSSETQDEMTMELIQPGFRPTCPKVAVFDFDGTLSVIREGWQEIMLDMMVDRLLSCDTNETSVEIRALVSEFVMELTGKPTIFQMTRFTEELEQRGDRSHSPTYYLAQFETELGKRINFRKQQMRLDPSAAGEHRIPFVKECLEQMRKRGVPMYVISGTAQDYVREEIQLLGLAHFFDDRVYGPTDDPDAFSKQGLIESIVHSHHIDGQELVSFGDGVVEIEATIAVGGIAIGIAGDEAARDGRIDPWKRSRLIDAGVQVIMPDFEAHAALDQWLFDSVELPNC